ncbi:alpha/beta fold hydrolase [Pseudoroseicyclus aestuarii]|uniref:Pimeloyl-ACP methyl ester carboxylesterase n=1 Tax=Pseudoroseicyclus aestuarii TaxID=1795041 RepID=A0A318STY6_9RHOB|nr:alpha/beta fold hydrolase [Pseudoroseicyclus aestuarii]PYE85421.1 pimeloyl-ACP methyl ester carboxylesterase [Pseudoroseicyclus aestuarii]
MLNLVRHGARGDLPPLVIVHGLFGSARNWGGVARKLSETREVIAVDLRNHGDSPWRDSHDYPALAEDLADLIASEGGPVDVLGHSMGGKAAMMLALTRPELVRRLVVADIAPVGYGHDQSQYITAMRRVDLASIENRGDAQRQMGLDAAHGTFLVQSLDLKERRWKLNLDVLEREMPKILGWPESEGRFEGPTLILRGGESAYVLPEHEDRIMALFPQARIETIEGASHWLHAERPREVTQAVARFLD